LIPTVEMNRHETVITVDFTTTLVV